jgi:CTP:molybdopterin cytidylyltransferase MocA
MTGSAGGPASARCAGLLLAAGSGSRMGRPKALLALDGRLLVELGAAVLRDGGCDPVVVVLGAAADAVRHRARLADARIVDNPNWADGQAGSLRAGLTAVAGDDPDRPAAAVLIALVDQPGVPAGVVRRLIERWRAGAGPAVVAAYAGMPRNPVLLDRRVWDDVAASVEGDEGARRWLGAVARERPEQVTLVECGDIGDPADLDTPADVDALAASGRTRRN